MVIKQVLNHAELQELIRTGKPILIDFFATWCGPCRAISPRFEDFSKAFDGRVTFIKVDVDQQPDISSALGVTALPTFIGFNNGSQVDSVRGANANALESLVQKLAA